MSTTNNNTANYTVENLVAKYRNYVDDHCPKSYSVCEGKDGNLADVYTPLPPYCNTGEQLLISLYKATKGNNINKEIEKALLEYENAFYKDALSEDEYAYLCMHYSETVSYLFAHRDEWNVMGKELRHGISKERLRLVHEYIKPQKGARIFIADTEYCDLAVQFPNCIVEGFTGWNYKQKEVWALGEIRMAAFGIKSEIVSGEEEDDTYTYTLPEKGSVDVVIFRVNENKYFAQKIFGTECTNIEALYDLLKPGGQMLFFSEIESEMAGNGREMEFICFRKRIVNDKVISSIVSYEDNSLIGRGKSSYTMLEITKSPNHTVTIKDDVKSYKEVVSVDLIDSEILWPRFYMIKRPLDGKPLSSIAEILPENNLSVFVDGKGFILPESTKDMQLVLPNMFGDCYKDANLWHKPDYSVNAPAFNEIDWVDFKLAKQPCILLSSNKETLKVGYTTGCPEKGFAYMAGCVLVPKDGIDLRYLAALLFEPSVKEQILTICGGSLNRTIMSVVFDKILIPDHNELERMRFLEEANYEALISSQEEMELVFEERFSKMKNDYINEVRMRKHDMRPHLRQLASSERLMLYFIDNISNSDELKKVLKEQIAKGHDALEGLSELVDHLSDEERFGEPERINLNKFFEDLEINHNDDEGFTLETYCEEAVSQLRGESIVELVEHAKAKGITYEQFLKQYNTDTTPLYVRIAPVDLNRLVNNIVENARRHGFTDKTRKDYYLSVDVKIDEHRDMYQIDFCNNGNPLPVGMTKERYGLKGEKAGTNAGTGNGGYIVRSIVEHYGGDFDVFTNEGITTIRIYLPKNSIE